MDQVLIDTPSFIAKRAKVQQDVTQEKQLNVLDVQTFISKINGRFI